MKCSVLLPVYNAGPPLRRAIESILQQEEPDFEFLIIDDCSTDGSQSTIRQFAAGDPRIRAIFHPVNLGLAHTLNEGMEKARTDLVARMDQDDEALPHRFTTQIRFMRSRPAVAVAGSFVYHMGATERQDRIIKLPTEHEDIVQALPIANCIYHPSVIFRREAILALGGYRSAFKNAEDYDLWLRAGAVYRLANLPVPLLRYRFSTGGMTLGKKWQQMFYVQMALASHRNPHLEQAALESAADEALRSLDKVWFLEQVAHGTIRELTRLSLWSDAFKVLLQFSRQLNPGRRRQLAWIFASHIYAEWRRSRVLKAGLNLPV